MDNNRIAAVRAALLQTTATVGWGYVKSLANSVVQQTVQAALDEENPVLGEAKRLKASAIQKGFKELFTAIETTKGIDLGNNDAGLGEITNEEIAKKEE